MKQIIKNNIVIIILTLAVVFLGYQNYKIDKELRAQGTIITNVGDAVLATASFVNMASNGEFQKFIEQKQQEKK